MLLGFMFIFLPTEKEWDPKNCFVSGKQLSLAQWNSWLLFFWAGTSRSSRNIGKSCSDPYLQLFSQDQKLFNSMIIVFWLSKQTVRKWISHNFGVWNPNNQESHILSIPLKNFPSPMLRISTGRFKTLLLRMSDIFTQEWKCIENQERFDVQLLLKQCLVY